MLKTSKTQKTLRTAKEIGHKETKVVQKNSLKSNPGSKQARNFQKVQNQRIPTDEAEIKKLAKEIVRELNRPTSSGQGVPEHRPTLTEMDSILHSRRTNRDLDISNFSFAFKFQTQNSVLQSNKSPKTTQTHKIHQNTQPQLRITSPQSQNRLKTPIGQNQVSGLSGPLEGQESHSQITFGGESFLKRSGKGGSSVQTAHFLQKSGALKQQQTFELSVGEGLKEGVKGAYGGNGGRGLLGSQVVSGDWASLRSRGNEDLSRNEANGGVNGGILRSFGAVDGLEGPGMASGGILRSEVQELMSFDGRNIKPRG